MEDVQEIRLGTSTLCWWGVHGASTTQNGVGKSLLVEK